MLYIPSPIAIIYRLSFQALANRSGRMQYYCADRSGTRKRITRSEFIDAFNNSPIIAMKPLRQDLHPELFQVEFYVK
jgi:hypothetical protein